MNDSSPPIDAKSDRVGEILRLLELMAAGDTEKRLPISDRRDELDAIAYAVNVLVGELEWTAKRVVEAQEERAAAAERASVAKNEFFRNLSHEIRTPIAAMLAFADLLTSDGLASPQQAADTVRQLMANGQAVMALLDDVLDLARLDADKVVLKPERVAPIDVVREVLASLEFASRSKGLEVRIDSTNEALGSVQTDRYRLRQILVNLVANAIKFSDAGSVIVSLRVVQGADGKQWTIDVTDYGVGIPEDERKHLFEPFQQANPSIGRAYGGNGLGLALSRRLAEHLGGTLVLQHSTPRAGTTFRLTLKPLQVAQPAAFVDDGQSASLEGAISGVRVLLAEDHRELHAALRERLERAGAAVESAHDGRQAVASVMATPFDVVLMDLRMPNMDGLQATRDLRSQGSVVPIIALTADPATLLRKEALDAGCDACLSKPFTIDDLISSIKLSTRLPAD